MTMPALLPTCRSRDARLGTPAELAAIGAAALPLRGRMARAAEARTARSHF